MQFVNPVFLFGLFAIAIPVIIHLFNFRRFRKVYFTNVRFIRQLKQQTQKRSQIRHLIILALRILAFSALIFAFAQPYIPHKSGQAPIASRNAVSIFVDNSFSMEAVGGSGSLLDEAVTKAREIVAAYKPSDYFQLLSNDFEGRHQRFVPRDEFLLMLDELKVSPSSRKAREIFTRQSDLFGTLPGVRHTSFIISDFQKSAYPEMPAGIDSTIHAYLIPLVPNKTGNVYVDSCWFDLPLQQAGQNALLNVRVWNKSDTDLEKIPVKLEINGQQRAVAGIDLKGGASATIRMSFINYTAGIHQGSVQVTDYPVSYDDKFYFSYEVTASLKVLAINGAEENRFIRSLFAQDSSILIRQAFEKLLDYSQLSSYNLIIMNELQSVSTGLAQEIRRYLENSGTIAIIPSSRPDLISYNAFLSSIGCPTYLAMDTSNNKVASLNVESPVFRDVFEDSAESGKRLPENMEMPEVFRYFPIVAGSTMQTKSLMEMMNGRSLFTVTSTLNGQVFQFAVPFDPAFSNFPRQALFVPTLYNIALVSKPPMQLYQKAGTNDAIRINRPPSENDQVMKVISKTDKFETIPEHRRIGNSSFLYLNGQVTTAGNFLLLAQPDTLAGLSFNYDRSESDLSCWNKDEVEEMIDKARLDKFSVLTTDHKPVNEILEEINQGKKLWKYFIWMALAFLLAEVVLLRIWKY